MNNEFNREERYIVFKLSDLGNSLKGDEIRRLAREYAEHRQRLRKKPLECVVVEKDWPEYESTWKAIEARVNGAQPAPNAVAYLDLGVGGYMDIGTDLTDEELDALPKGRHMLGIVGTYGIDGYFPAQPAPSAPDGWLRAIDEALVIAHIGVANAHDTYEQAKAKLDSLIGLHVDIATDPAVNGGWKLMPVEPTTEIRKAMHYAYWQSPQLPYHDGSPELWNAAYAAMLAAAPEAKP